MMSPLTKAGFVALIAAVALTGNAAEQPSAPTEPLGQGTPFADGSIDAGMQKAATCGACHGPSGNSTNTQWPKLAGQNAVYVSEQLQLFKAGVRVNPVMLGMAVSLTDKDIDNLAVYYQAQTPVGGEADKTLAQAGEKLYRYGDPARDIPACTSCHGPVGRGNSLSDYPALRAQFSEYVSKQLSDYASGARYAAKAGAPSSRNGYMMETIAKRLSAEDIKDVAAYVQGMR